MARIPVSAENSAYIAVCDAVVLSQIEGENGASGGCQRGDRHHGKLREWWPFAGYVVTTR